MVNQLFNIFKIEYHFYIKRNFTINENSVVNYYNLHKIFDKHLIKKCKIHEKRHGDAI